MSLLKPSAPLFSFLAVVFAANAAFSQTSTIFPPSTTSAKTEEEKPSPLSTKEPPAVEPFTAGSASAYISSLGKSRISIFFSPKQIEILGSALEEFEKNGKALISPSTVLSVAGSTSSPTATPLIVEPETYPLFYLSSIVYRNTKDWSLWVSSHKITPSKNNTDLKVISVSAERATFSWKPDFYDTLVLRHQKDLFAPVDAVKNKLTKPQTFLFDEKTGTVHFTLRANQTFSPAYMHTFEGYIESPALAKIDPAPPSTSAANKTPSPAITPSSNTNAEVVADPTLIDTRPVNPLDAPGDARKEINAQLKRQEAAQMPAAATSAPPQPKTE